MTHTALRVLTGQSIHKSATFVPHRTSLRHISGKAWVILIIKHKLITIHWNYRLHWNNLNHWNRPLYIIVFNIRFKLTLLEVQLIDTGTCTSWMIHLALSSGLVLHRSVVDEQIWRWILEPLRWTSMFDYPGEPLHIHLIAHLVRGQHCPIPTRTSSLQSLSMSLHLHSIYISSTYIYSEY